LSILESVATIERAPSAQGGARRTGALIRVGTAGWHYDDWNGVVYPRPRPRGFDALTALALIFGAIEVNVTFYRTPDPSMVASWVERTAANERFRFTVKLPRSFTHEPAPDNEHEEQLFRDSIAPLMDAKRLGAVLIQFPQSFHRTPEAEAYLEDLLTRFRGLPLVVEFRHAGWGQEETLALLRGRGAGFCNIDQPRLGSTLRPTAFMTSSVGYVRLHGRNAAEWFREGRTRPRRYD